LALLGRNTILSEKFLRGQGSIVLLHQRRRRRWCWPLDPHPSSRWRDKYSAEKCSWARAFRGF